MLLYADRIAGLVIKEAPNLDGEVRKAHKFYPASSSSSRKEYVTFEEADFNKLKELPICLFHVSLISLISKGLT